MNEKPLRALLRFVVPGLIAPAIAVSTLGFTLLGPATSASVFAVESEARGALHCKGLLNTDKGETVLDARLDAEAEIGVFTLGGSYRAYDLSDKKYNPAGIQVPQPDIKHRYAEIKTHGAFARAGHFFATFGRGLALRSFEEVALEHDTALDGLLVEYETGPFKLSGLSGKMDERISDVQRREHEVRGGRAVVSSADRFSLAASTLERKTHKRDEEFDDTMLGAEAELWCGPGSLSCEYVRREGGYYPTSQQRGADGHGAYLSGTLSTGWLTLLGEYKDYERFDNALVNPPTCVKEHLSTLMNRVTHQVDLNDERGYLVEGTLTAFESTTLAGGASEARNDAGRLLHWEMFGDLERPMGAWGRTSAGLSWSREYVEGKFTEYVSGAADADLVVGGSPVIELGVEAQRTREPSGETRQDYLASFAWYARSEITFAASAEAASKPESGRDLWVFGEVRLVLAYDLEGSLGLGTERGGKKCSGGICYTEPEFAGVRVRLSKVF